MAKKHIILWLIGLMLFTTFFNGCPKQPKPEPPEPPPPPTIATVAQDIQFQNTGFMLSNFSFFEGLWVKYRYCSQGQWVEILNKYAESDAGSWGRSFLFPGSAWSWKGKKWLIPIFKIKDGKYQLPKPWNAETQIGEFINPKWVNHVIWVIKRKVEREIGEMLSLWDNCGFHNYPGGGWNHNFLNPDNNNLTNLSDHPHAYYLYAEKSDNPQMQNTGKIVEAMTRYMLKRIHDELTSHERQYIALELVNEGQAGEAFHMRMKQIIDKTWGSDCPRKRRFTSTSKLTPKIRNNFSPIIHQIGTLKRYKDRVQAQHKGVSTDGYSLYMDDHGGDKDYRIPVLKETAKKLLEKALNQNKVLYEFLHFHRHNYIRLPDGDSNPTPGFYNFSAIEWDTMQALVSELRKQLTQD